MIIKKIETIPLNLTLDPGIALHLSRSSHTGKVALYRVHLDNGTVGYGEVVGEADDVSAFVGRDAVQGLRDIPHSGVQMACYDAVGKALGVPAHALMGRQVRPHVPYAYWSIDLPPDVFAAQAQRAAELGYRVYKYKCRPWWNPIEQIERASQVVPDGFQFWLDFNGHLRETRQALPILKKLAEFDCVGAFESPIPQRDAEGYKELRRKIDRPIAAHFGSGCCHVRSDPTYDRGTPALTQIAEKLCDGFVLSGSDVDSVRRHAAVAAEARIPFWIQTVGTGLRAAWVVHLASTCQQGLLSHLAAQNVWQRDIAAAPAVQNGWVDVPTEPGLGVALLEDRVEEYRNAPPIGSLRRISTVVYPDGLRAHFATEQQRHETFYFGNLPGFVPGIRLEVREDDQSQDFDELYTRCLTAPVVEKAEA